jgi:cytidylate kinase
MWKNIGMENCLAFINCQLSPAGQATAPTAKVSVTISRMTGAGGRTVAGKLAEYLQAHAAGACPWTVFDKHLMEKVLEDHHLSKEVAKYQPESHKPFIRDALEEILGLHPSSWTLVQHTAETIWKLANMGCVILVGRGASVVTASLKHVYHVRLVGSQEQRAQRVQEVYHLDPKAALEFVKTNDTGRRRYVKDHYHKDIDDPVLYDLVINTDNTSYENAARLIGEAVIQRYNLNRPASTVVP